MTCHEALLVSIPAYTRERGCQNQPASWFFTQVFTFFYRFGMGIFPRRLANSQGTADALAREGYPASGVVATGVERETFNPKPPEALPEAEPARFVFCGRLTPIKNVDLALLALFPLRGERPSFHFDIIGDGAERSRLEQITRAAGAEKWVTFHGQVTEEAKRAILGASEIFLLSSPREGLSLATLEAMAQGCGALIVNNPACPNGALDFIRHNEQGVVVPPGIEPMREALRSLIKNRDDRLALRRAAWRKAQDYSVEGQTHQLAAFYRESLNVPSSRAKAVRKKRPGGN
jgi:glycosyltransferase involved in cell wall biosynthesis